MMDNHRKYIYPGMLFALFIVSFHLFRSFETLHHREKADQVHLYSILTGGAQRSLCICIACARLFFVIDKLYIKQLKINMICTFNQIFN